MDKGGDGHVPGGVSGHSKAQKGPNPVVMERRNENGCSTTSSKNISPSSLVQMVIDVINIADEKRTQILKIKQTQIKSSLKKGEAILTLHKQ